MITVRGNSSCCHLILTETEGSQSNTPCGEEHFRTVYSILFRPPCTDLPSPNASALQMIINGTNERPKRMVTSVVASQLQCNGSEQPRQGEIITATRSWHSKKAQSSSQSLLKRGLHERQISLHISILMLHCGNTLSRQSTGFRDTTGDVLVLG